MGTFRSLSADDVRAILSAFGIDGYVGHTPIAAGTINTNVSVETKGRRLFLRINEGKSREDVEREAAIVSHVAERGVPHAGPLHTPGGEPLVSWAGTLASVFPWVPGRVLSRAEVASGHAREAGRALAALHLAGADFPDRRVGRYEPAEIHRRLERIGKHTGDPVLDEGVAILRPELALLAEERRHAALPAGVIHGDLFIDNVLFGPSETLTALLDFEQASWGCLAYDVAVSALAFGFGEDDFRPDVVRAFLQGYRSQRPPEPAERIAFGAELRFAACRFAVTRITDVYLRRTAGAPDGKDFRRYVLRLRRVREHLDARDGLLALG